MKTRTKTTRKRVYPILQQIVQYLPELTLEKLANKHRIFAVVELNGKKHDMVFLTNNLDWAKL